MAELVTLSEDWDVWVCPDCGEINDAEPDKIGAVQCSSCSEIFATRRVNN